MNQNKMINKTTIIIAILALITVAALSVTIWAVFFREEGDGGDVVLAPDYAPQNKEENAEPIPDDTGDKMENPQGGGAVSLTYLNEVTIDISDKAAALYFANPGKSNQDILIQIAIRDTVILQSGTLSPGNQVKLLNLLEGAENKLQPGGYNGKFIVLYYDPISGEKSMVNTEIPITITVVK
ncbi:MAG: hypothetical protein IJ445_03830 [Clostridia bacterium]|nr:hypothetical protein [Clostridia bacterium]